MVTQEEVLRFVEENDVQFIRLAFCDIFGVQKNISIMPSELPRALQSGVSFDGSAIDGFTDEGRSDLFLVPDLQTLTVLPWRPSHGRVARFFCDIRNGDGTPFAQDGRAILKQAVRTLRDAGYGCYIGAECEFYLFKTDADGNATDEPFDDGGYMDIAPADRGENVRREICLTLNEMGIAPESSHHEQGPGQNEIDFRYSDPLTSADQVITFKAAVTTIASKNGLFATFAPKPLKDKSGNGFHINMSVHRLGDLDAEDDCLSPFMAGILRHAAEITAFLNPSVESYRRLGHHKAPAYVSWAPENRSQLIRIPAGDEAHRRLELRSPDPLADPYLAYALLLYAGLEGLENGWTPPPPTEQNLYNAPQKLLAELEALPLSYKDAYERAYHSAFVRAHLPAAVIEGYGLRL